MSYMEAIAPWFPWSSFTELKLRAEATVSDRQWTVKSRHVLDVW